MTFGFGRDTDEVNGFESMRSIGLVRDGDLDHSDSSDSFYDRSGHCRFRAQLPIRQRAPRSWNDHHPIYDPSKVKCAFCKQWGHSLMNCFKRMEHHWEMMESHCKRGYHKPHLHDCTDLWRCEWCLTHLRTDYVRKHYPREFDFEIAKVEEQRAANLQRYSDSAAS